MCKARIVKVVMTSDQGDLIFLNPRNREQFQRRWEDVRRKKLWKKIEAAMKKEDGRKSDLPG